MLADVSASKVSPTEAGNTTTSTTLSHHVGHRVTGVPPAAAHEASMPYVCLAEVAVPAFLTTAPRFAHINYSQIFVR